MPTAAVSLHSLASAVEESDAPLFQQYLAHDFRDDHRQLEFHWGLELFTFNEDHERSIVQVRKSMLNLPHGRWALVPTEETMSAMLVMQKHNILSPVSQRKSFLTEFSDPTYEYLFIPLRTDIDFFVIEAGRAPQRYPAPYHDFPRIKSSANPFFVMLAASAQSQVDICNAPGISKAWRSSYLQLTIHWLRPNLPQAFVLSCFPEDLVSDIGDEPDSDSLRTPTETNPQEERHVKRKASSPRLDDLSPPADKGLLISNWVQHDADPTLLSPPIVEFESPWPPSAPVEKPRPVLEVVFHEPSWYTDSDQGKIYVDRFYYPLPE
ncbi:hypothetical protein C8J56DRAFT_914015 [Mycena floridula]|nr:hypothetical protein C8J56DRAFT_914015 [Mycena floridula]